MMTASPALSTSDPSSAEQPKVTIVVVPRERFSCARQSLESLFAHTQLPYKLVYVDGNSPASLREYLKREAEQRSFQIIRTDYYLYPNQARNLGLSVVDTPYVAFVDNDVIVSPGWLTALVRCAEETDAAVVGPLMCEREPIHKVVHFAGGESHVWTDVKGRRRLREKMYDQGKHVEDIRQRLTRSQTELAEFHCVLVRRSIFDAIGALDSRMLNTKEHLDFCMSVRQAGGTVYFEPDSLVTYVPGSPQHWTDVHYYMLRWSDAWTVKSLRHLQAKWDLAEDGYFKNKYKKLGWRRYGTLIEPFVRKLTFGVGNEFMTRAVAKVEHSVNAALTAYHAVRQPRPPHGSASPTTELVTSTSGQASSKNPVR